jgi:ankyrin repeat protein
MVSSEGREVEARALVEVGGADVNLEAWMFDDDDQGAHAGENTSAWKQRRTALMEGAHKGHTHLVQTLIELGAKVNQGKSDTGGTALMNGAQGGHVAVVRLLLENGADVNTPNKDGSTSVHFALTDGNAEMLKVLIAAGVDVNQADSMACTPLFFAVQLGHTETVRLLLEHNAEVELASAFNGLTPLHLAVQLAHIEAVQVLLEYGAKVEQTTSDGFTPLLLAAQEGYSEITQALLDRGAAVDKENQINFDTPLIMACCYGHVAVVRLLLKKGAAVNQERRGMNNSVTPLHMAAVRAHVEVVQVLLENGASAIQRRPDGITALMTSCNVGHVAVVRMLLENGAVVNQVATGSNTTTSVDANENYPNGARVCQVMLASGTTALLEASWNGRMEVAQLLLENSADVNQPRIGIHASMGAPLHAAVQNERADMALLLLENGAAVNQRTTTPGQHTAAFEAAIKGDLTTLQHLAIFCANMSVVHDASVISGYGTSASEIAVKCGWVVLSKWLAAVKAWSPLQIAAGCRLYRVATTALKLGLIDPEQGGVGAMLAARAVSTSNAPWGTLDAPGYIANNHLPDLVDAATEVGKKHLVTLAHAPSCTFTAKFIRAATSGWSATRHWLHHPTVRTVVHTVLLVAERLHQEAHAVRSTASVAASSVEGTHPNINAAAIVPTTDDAFPQVPSELWLAIMRFFLRSDWLHTPALKQLPSLLVRRFPPGTRVELVGLKAWAWNGKQGTVMPDMGSKAAVGRVLVLVDGDESTKHLNHSNLVRQFPPGTRVELVGLKAVAWNGKRGVVLPDAAAEGRVAVTVDGDQNPRSFLHSNLQRKFSIVQTTVSP